MNISKEQSCELLGALGFQNVGSYSDKKIVEKLSSLHTTKGGPAAIDKLADENLKNFGTEVLEARKKNVTLVLVDDTVYDLGDDEDEDPQEENTVTTKAAPSSNGKPAKPVAKPAPVAAKTSPRPAVKPTAPAPKKAEAKTPVEVPKKPKAEPAGTDPFGSRLGTRAARINAAVGKEFKSSAQIKEDAKYDKDPNPHLRWMIEKGWAEFFRGHGYRLTNAALTALGQKADQKPPAPVEKEKPKAKAEPVAKTPAPAPKKPVAPAAKAPAAAPKKPAPAAKKPAPKK